MAFPGCEDCQKSTCCTFFVVFATTGFSNARVRTGLAARLRGGLGWVGFGMRCTPPRTTIPAWGVPAMQGDMCSHTASHTASHTTTSKANSDPTRTHKSHRATFLGPSGPGELCVALGISRALEIRAAGIPMDYWRSPWGQLESPWAHLNSNISVMSYGQYELYSHSAEMEPLHKTHRHDARDNCGLWRNGQHPLESA